MKKERRKVGCIIFLVLGVAYLLLGSTSLAQASDYRGEFCFQSALDETIYRLALTDMGNSHFLVNGKMTAANGNSLPFHGNAEVGQLIELTINGGALYSSNGTTIDSTTSITINYIVDVSSLTGIGRGILTQDINGVITSSSINDIINVVACP